MSLREVGHLFVQCAPLFGALFLFNLIESMPKFVMEGTLAYKYQLYFNALFFPAQAILLSIGFVYKPQLLRLSSIWANPRKRRRFDLIIIAVMALIVAITGVCAAFMAGPGIPLMSFMYGLNFERYRTLALLMVVADGMGGHFYGEVAAQIAVQTLTEAFQRQATPSIADPFLFLQKAMIHALSATISPITPRQLPSASDAKKMAMTVTSNAVIVSRQRPH